MSNRQFETTVPAKAESTLAHQTEAEAAQQAYHYPLTRVALGASGVPRPQAQAEALVQASGGRLARAGDALLQLQRDYGNRYVQRVVNHARQLEAEPGRPANRTRMPDNLKTAIESLSGISMDNVKVHYNSSQPAQLNALAYAQGSDIHVAPGQERHLPHEAWHLVQQAQGRVKPTMQMKDGVPVNDDEGLEHEADVMGAMAAEGDPASPSRFSQDGVGLDQPISQRHPLSGRRQKWPLNFLSAGADDGIVTSVNRHSSGRTIRGPVIQRVLEKNKLNIVGEHHSISRGARVLEKNFVENKGLGKYWNEDEFEVVTGVDRRPGDDPGLRAQHRLKVVLKLCREFKQPVQENLMAWTDKEKAALDRRAMLKIAGHLLQAGAEMKRKSPGQEHVLTEFGTRIKRALPTLAKKDYLEQHELIEKWISQIETTAERFSEDPERTNIAMVRSKYMYDSAKESREFGVWKVGEAHIADMESLIDGNADNVTLTHELEFAIALFRWQRDIPMV